jgi:hypothetical protein
MPIGGWDLRNGTLRAPILATGSFTLTVPDGAILDNLAVVDHALFVSFAPTTFDGCLTFSYAAAAGVPWTVFIDQGALIANYGTKALVDLSSVPPDTFFVLALSAPPFSAFPPSTAPLIKQAAPAVVIVSQVEVGVYGDIPTGWIIGSGTLIYQLGLSGVVPATPGWTGTPAVVRPSSVTALDAGTNNTVSLTLPGGVSTLTSADSLGAATPFNLAIDELQINSSPGAANEVLSSQGAGLPPIWTALPSNGSLTPKLGRVLLVDDINGNDLTGTVNGPAFKTVEAAISYINTNSLTGVTIWVMPGTYTLASATTGITIPDTCSIRGMSVQTTRIAMNASNPGGTVTLLTMGENTRVEDLTFTLTSTNATTNLAAIHLPGSTSVTSKLRTTVVTVDNSTVPVGSTTNVYGVLSDGTGALNAGTFSFNTLKGSTLNVYSNGSGNKFGIYQPNTDANQLSTRDMNIYVRAPIDAASLGRYVGLYTDNNNSQIQTRSTTIGGSPYPAVQLKLPVSVTATSNITLSSTYTLQGVALSVGDRVLAAGQTVGTGNGIWVVQSGAWTRALDMAAGSAALGVYTFCRNGTYTHTGWECTTTANVGASALTFVQRYAGCDVLQNAPQAGAGTNGIQLGPGTDIVNKTAGTHAFSTYVTPTTIQFCLRGNIDAGTHWLWPGTLVNTMDNQEVFYRFQQKSVLQGMFVNLRTAPGVGKSLTVTINKSSTPTSPGAATLMKATISGTDTSATCYTSSVDFAQFEFLSVQVDCSNGSSAADLVVEIDLF